MVVITELEGKRHHPELGYFARAALRLLDELRVTHGRLDEPLPVGEEGGHAAGRTEPHRPGDPAVRLPRSATTTPASWPWPATSPRDGADVTLVSKDLPMRVKASAVGLRAEEYRASRSDWTPADRHGRARGREPTMDELYENGVLELRAAGSCPPHRAGAAVRAGRGARPGDAGQDVRLVRGDREAFGLRGRSAEQRVALDLLLDDPMSGSSRWAAAPVPASRRWRCAPGSRR